MDGLDTKAPPASLNGAVERLKSAAAQVSAEGPKRGRGRPAGSGRPPQNGTGPQAAKNPAPGTAPVVAPPGSFTEANTGYIHEALFGFVAIKTNCAVFILEPKEKEELAKTGMLVGNEYVKLNPKWLNASLYAISLGCIIFKKVLLWQAVKAPAVKMPAQEIKKDEVKEEVKQPSPSVPSGPSGSPSVAEPSDTMPLPFGPTVAGKNGS